ncbi:hypothetical protein [Desulfosporosinus sp. BG]|uniref:hypothetical protein n=1 Tax=Desulfosporosinus sp. BG TaxID=1633135 RepID=UPI00083AC093|nr:hypothetical protein [Desulfosporosinus sp. BG]ODA41718.1 hypothetical protein DSBG_1435 [Desulfosporosinus sp. BG]
MAYSPGEINFQRLVKPTASPFLQSLSVRRVKGITGVFLFGTVLGFLLFWQPAYLHWRSLQKEKTYWQQVLRTGSVITKLQTKADIMPTMDQLPDIIERCQGEFDKERVDVVTLNVERFGERRETGKGVGLDYSLVRFHLRGNWEGIVTSLKLLEETSVGNIHLQEVVLDAEGGEALLQIYFCTGG